ncbi:MAG: alpha/beta hydrolase [Vitreoscilla sp.]|nr:alpha/beta hydrolase [Vitreoscilla sp.]
MTTSTTKPLGTEARIAAFEATVEHRYADCAGVRIHYAATGAGPLVVLLHGFPDHWLGWWQVMEALRSDYRVAAMDLRGYNLSDKPGDPSAYGVECLIKDVRAVIHDQGAARATVVGHDWGGFVAWHVGMDAPELIEGLVVMNMPHPWAIARELALNPDQLKASEYVRLFKQPEAHRHFPVPRLGAWVADPDYKARHEEAMAESSLDAMFNYYRVNWPSEPYAARKDDPPKVKAPTLLIHGLKDPYALPAGLNDAWNWVDNEVEIYTLPRAGHFVQHEQAARVSARLLQWLGRAGRRTSPDRVEEDRS